MNTTKRFLVTQIELAEHKHETYHWLAIPAIGEPDFYRQTTSLNGFFFNYRNQAKKKGNWFLPGKVFYITPEEEVPERWIKKGVPQIVHKTLWLFYRHIEYDYKSQKQVKTMLLVG